MPVRPLHFTNQQVPSPEIAFRALVSSVGGSSLHELVCPLFEPVLWRIHAANPLRSQYAFWGSPPANAIHPNFTQFRRAFQPLTSQAPDLIFIKSRLPWDRRCRWDVPALSVTLLYQDYRWQLSLTQNHRLWGKARGTTLRNTTFLPLLAEVATHC